MAGKSPATSEVAALAGEPMSERPTTRAAAVLCRAGFVCRAVTAKLSAHGRQMRPVLAPRLRRQRLESWHR